MEPYNKNLPFIRFANDGKTVLDRLAESGIPLTRALQYFRNNPEGNALEFFKLIGEDIIPFYGNYRNGGDVSDYAKEAALMFMPWQIKAYRKPSTFKPDPQRKYYANDEPLYRHKLFTDSDRPGIIESVPEVGDAGRMSGGSNAYYEVDPNKFIQDQQQLAEMSIDAARTVPSRYESVGDIKLESGGNRHYTYGGLMNKYEKVIKDLDNFNWKKGWKRDFNRDPLTAEEQQKMFKLNNLKNEIELELGLSKEELQSTYGPFYEDLMPEYSRTLDYKTILERKKEIGKLPNTSETP